MIEKTALGDYRQGTTFVRSGGSRKFPETFFAGLSLRAQYERRSINYYSTGEYGVSSLVGLNGLTGAVEVICWNRLGSAAVSKMISNKSRRLFTDVKPFSIMRPAEIASKYAVSEIVLAEALKDVAAAGAMQIEGGVSTVPKEKYAVYEIDQQQNDPAGTRARIFSFSPKLKLTNRFAAVLTIAQDGPITDMVALDIEGPLSTAREFLRDTDFSVPEQQAEHDVLGQTVYVRLQEHEHRKMETVLATGVALRSAVTLPWTLDRVI